MDDGSNDETLEILQEFAAKEKRIKLLHSEKKSYGYQMNLGIKTAQGEYIGIVETDDFTSPNMYANLYKMAKENRADVVKSNFLNTLCLKLLKILEIILIIKWLVF